MSINHKDDSVATQVKEDGLKDKEKSIGDAKSETSPQKRSASELNNDGEVKHKHLKTDNKEEKENGEDHGNGQDDEDAVPDDYDEEGEDGEGDEDAADEEDDEDEEDEA